MAEIKREYSIPYHSLSIGIHPFEFECDNDFFNRMSGGMFAKGNCTVSVEVLKGANLATINCEITGEIEVECDRCLELYMAEVKFDGSIFVKFSHEVDDPTFENDSDGESDILWMNPSDSLIDLEQYIYESVILSLPQRRIHPLDENGVSLCNPEMLARFSIEPDDMQDDEDEWDEDEIEEYFDEDED